MSGSLAGHLRPWFCRPGRASVIEGVEVVDRASILTARRGYHEDHDAEDEASHGERQEQLQNVRRRSEGHCGSESVSGALFWIGIAARACGNAEVHRAASQLVIKSFGDA